MNFCADFGKQFAKVMKFINYSQKNYAKTIDKKVFMGYNVAIILFYSICEYSMHTMNFYSLLNRMVNEQDKVE